MGRYTSIYENINDDLELYKLILEGRLGKFPNGFWYKPWSIQSAIKITKYLIEDILKLDKEAIPKINRIVLKEYKLLGMLKIVYNYNINEMIESAYPNTYKPWEYNKVSPGYWDEETAKEATRWLIQKVSQFKKYDLCKLQSSDFLNNGLKVPLDKIYGYNVYKAIDALYPGKYMQWEFTHVPKYYWNQITAKAAVIWLVRDKLRLTDNTIDKLTTKDILDNGLIEILYNVYNGLDDLINKTRDYMKEGKEVYETSNSYTSSIIAKH